MSNFLYCKVLVKGKAIFGPCTLLLFFQQCLSEMLSTGFLVFLCCMGAGVGTMFETLKPIEYVIQHFNYGMAVMIPLLIYGHISGAHMNPALSVCLCIIGHLTLAMLPVYILMQCIGATLGYGLLYVLTPPYHGKTICVNSVNKTIGPWRGVVFEAIATGIFCLVVCGVLDKRNIKRTESPAIKYGLTITGLALVLGCWSSASMNPARSLGPCVWTLQWEELWVSLAILNKKNREWPLLDFLGTRIQGMVFWLGPFAGGLFTGVFYKYVLAERYLRDVSFSQAPVGETREETKTS